MNPPVTTTSPLTARFWGVRGTIPCAGPKLSRYGGNTACVEVRCGDKLLILDAGSGLRLLGEDLRGHTGGVEADIFLSHFHLDHLIGLPFFEPAFEPVNRFRVWAGHPGDGGSVQAALRSLMGEPLLPVGPEAFKAMIEFRDFRRGDTLNLQPGLLIRTASLRHPGGATGYRIEYGGRSIAYITDTEHAPQGLDPEVLALAHRADLVIYDATYTEAEYHKRIGWGHSTWQEGMRLADAAESKMLALFHHDPDHDDGCMDTIAEQAAAARPGTIVAQEGCTLYL